MKKTIFEGRVLSPFFKRVSGPLLHLFGWGTEGELPEKKKFVMIAAPHTSNWDLVVTLLLAFAFELKIFWMGKDALFRFPFGWFMRWLGGISIDRSKSNNVVEQTIEVFNEHDEIVITVPPEGTRGKTHYWKTGFYHIANGAGVPIVLGFIDWGRKMGGVGPAILPTGNIEEDMEKIKEFYKDMKGKFDTQFCKGELDDGKVVQIP